MPKFNTVRKFVIWINAIAFVLDVLVAHWPSAAFAAFVATLFAFGIDTNGHFWFEDSFMEEEKEELNIDVKHSVSKENIRVLERIHSKPFVKDGILWWSPPEWLKLMRRTAQ